VTCRHASALIDAAGLVDDPSARRALERHAVECASCRRALSAAAAVSRQLTELPLLPPSYDLAPAILARIAEDAAVPADAAVAVAQAAAATAGDGWSAWAMVAGGATAAAAYVIGAPVSGGGFPIGIGIERGSLATPMSGFVALGVLVYLTGLFTSSRALADGRRGER
jgi:hypothetical protein